MQNIHQYLLNSWFWRSLCRVGELSTLAASAQDLFKVKHPTAWLDFEKGLISDDEFRSSFYADLREFDESEYDGLKACMYEGYAWLDGIQLPKTL